ncbi:hypothetical protein L8W69_02690 [Campylobacter sp. CNRCH_2016_3089]|nr:MULTISPECIES: hypothetical protein [Campylobacter]MCV3394265.1 hypothetical protein [Campylobacter sp. IFREMER_LSEM_CL908]MCV3402635.1 hypothetical protein [Campylobacter sp. IFREMER_LSEM_CL2090]MCV3508134.1 hypothetical protein [Campylobacter sp. CNRCH_2016_3089]MCV3548418.1 hypothetical protein [Campylobacter sp. CNRCH_2013_0671h]MCW0185592.1 hypothetical protein [Campylobacter lari]
MKLELPLEVLYILGQQNYNFLMSLTGILCGFSLLLLVVLLIASFKS